MTEVEWKTNEKQTDLISKPDKSEMFPPKKDPLLRSWKINSVSGYYALVLRQSPWHPDVLHLKKMELEASDLPTLMGKTFG